MIGAIFYASKYGSTEQYARWISAATGLPAFDMAAAPPDPMDYDFVILGAPVIYHKLLRRRWLIRHQAAILSRPAILFTVSGAGPGAKLDRWLANDLPGPLLDHLDHVALRRRQDPNILTWFDRMMLIVAGLANRDRKAGREELHGFDFMDQASIQPIVAKIRALEGAPAARSVGD